jgi:hypothetical protein
MAIGRGRHWGAQTAIAAGVALLAASLAGTPLYVSSSSSAAVQQQIAASCPGEIALRLRAGRSSLLSPLDDVAAHVAHVKPVVLTRVATGTYTAQTAHGTSTLKLTLVTRTGQAEAVTPSVPELQLGEIAFPRGRFGDAELSLGQTIALTPPEAFAVEGLATSPPRAPIDLHVVSAFDDIPTFPEPSFWCDLRNLLRASGQGDPPSPMALASPLTLEIVSPSQPTEWQLPVDSRNLTHHQAVEVERVFAQLRAKLHELEARSGTPRSIDTGNDGLLVVLRRADALTSAIRRTIAPVRLAGGLAAAVLLVAASVMVARERRRELRLALLRGAHPWATLRWLWLMALRACTAGLAVGAGLAFAAVRVLGPAPQFEHDAVRSAMLAASIGAIGALVLVVAVAVWTGGRFVDARPRRRRWMWLPLELPLVVLAVFSYRRLTSVGGVHMFGVTSRGGDLLAQAFPLVGIFAVVALLVRPLGWVVARLRTTGRRLPRATRLGWRRAVGERGAAVALVSAVALSVGCSMIAVILSRTSTAELHDKAQLYVGADLAVRVDQPARVPQSLVGSATVTTRHTGRVGDEPVDVLGVDSATFARAAFWRSDGSDRSLASLLSLIDHTPAADGALDAIVIPGNVAVALAGQGEVVVDGRNLTAEERMIVHPVATARFFPGFQSGTTLIVVAEESLRATGVASVDTILVRRPPPNVLTTIAAVDGPVRGSQPAATVFESVTFSAERWAYGAVGAFAALLAVVALVMQLLVVESRRDVRRLSDVVLRRTAFGIRSTWVAAMVEIAVPVVVGVGIGTLGGRVVAGVAVAHLDPLRDLRPPPVAVVPVGGVIATIAVAVAATLLLATASVWSTRHADPMEVVRGTA